ncbi:hypothetical protein J3Q64DRAFT_1743549 [Phycomyces blakesleeanus]
MCDKSFTTSGHLARHNRIHTGEKNFQCLHPGCLSRFSRQDNMMQHYRTHISPKSRRHSHQRQHYHLMSHPYHRPTSPLEYYHHNTNSNPNPSRSPNYTRLYSDNRSVYLSESPYSQPLYHSLPPTTTSSAPKVVMTKVEPGLTNLSDQYNSHLPVHPVHVHRHQVYSHSAPPHSTSHGYLSPSRSIDSSPHGRLPKPQPIEPFMGPGAGVETGVIIPGPCPGSGLSSGLGSGSSVGHRNSHPRSVSSSPSSSSSPFLFSPLQFHASPPLQMAPYQPPDSAYNYPSYQSRPRYSVYSPPQHKLMSYDSYHSLPCTISSFA